MSWNVGLSTGACIDRPVTDVLGAFHQLNVRGVELGTRPDHFDITRPDQVAGVAAKLQALSIEAVSIHAPFGGVLDLAHPDLYHRTAAVAAILGASDALKQVGGHIVVVHPSDLPRHGNDVKARLDDAAQSLATIAERCQQDGMTLAIESPLPHLIGGHPDEFGTLLVKLDGSIKVCLDTGHTFLGGFWDRFLRVSQGRLVHVHANDNHGTYDDHLPPGEGRIDWPHVIRTLREAEFTGWMMLELHCTSPDIPGYFTAATQRAEALQVRG